MAIEEAGNVINLKSPTALLGVFLSILRARFDASQQLDWVYIPGDASRSESTIHIEAGQNPLTEDYGRRPAIFVNRGPITIGQTGIADRAHLDLKSGVDIFYAIAQTNWTFTTEAEQSAEAEVISDIVLSTLLMGSDIIEKFFRFRKLGPFALSSRAKTRQDTELTQVNVNMGMTYDMRWVNAPIVPILQEVIVNLRESTYNSPDEYFIQIAQNSLNTGPNS